MTVDEKIRKEANRVLGVMVGLACGDAVGLPYEFMNKYEILEKYGNVTGMRGGGTWGQEKGMVSDDTELALAVAEGICDDCYNPVPAIGKRILAWYDTKPFDVGSCTSSVIQMVKNGKTWEEAAKDYHDATGQSAGNGALMRTAYVGVFYDDKSKIEKMARQICRMTHWHKKAVRDCVLLSLIINALVKGEGKDGIERVITEYADSEKDYDLGVIEGECFYYRPSGYTENTMLCALRSVLKTDSFEDAVLMAVSMGGDTDTIGAITGAMAGALYGFEGIPMEWWFDLKPSPVIAQRILNVYSGWKEEKSKILEEH